MGTLRDEIRGYRAWCVVSICNFLLPKSGEERIVSIALSDTVSAREVGHILASTQACAAGCIPSDPRALREEPAWLGCAAVGWAGTWSRAGGAVDGAHCEAAVDEGFGLALWGVGSSQAGQATRRLAGTSRPTALSSAVALLGDFCT